MHWNQWNYPPIVQYTSQYVNVLIFLHYFAIVLIHFKSKDEIYLLEVSAQCRLVRACRRFSANCSGFVPRGRNLTEWFVPRPRLPRLPRCHPFGLLSKAEALATAAMKESATSSLTMLLLVWLSFRDLKLEGVLFILGLIGPERVSAGSSVHRHPMTFSRSRLSGPVTALIASTTLATARSRAPPGTYSSSTTSTFRSTIRRCAKCTNRALSQWPILR